MIQRIPRENLFDVTSALSRWDLDAIGMTSRKLHSFVRTTLSPRSGLCRRVFHAVVLYSAREALVYCGLDEWCASAPNAGFTEVNALFDSLQHSFVRTMGKRSSLQELGISSMFLVFF